MSGFEVAYACLQNSVECMEEAIKTENPAEKDALIRQAYEMLYQSVAQAGMISAASNPYGEKPEGGFYSFSSGIVSEFCSTAHRRYFLEGKYPRKKASSNSESEPENPDEALHVYEEWLDKARAFLHEAQSHAILMENSKYANDRSF